MPMTPGTYLRKRREAAATGLLQAAATLSVFYMLPRNTNPRATIAIRLERAECDEEPLNRLQLELIRQYVFPLDIEAYLQLVDCHADPANRDLPRPALCRECACSWNDACSDGPVGCHWVEQPGRDADGLCSVCLRGLAAGAIAAPAPAPNPTVPA